MRLHYVAAPDASRRVRLYVRKANAYLRKPESHYYDEAGLSKLTKYGIGLLVILTIVLVIIRKPPVEFDAGFMTAILLIFALERMIFRFTATPPSQWPYLNKAVKDGRAAVIPCELGEAYGFWLEIYNRQSSQAARSAYWREFCYAAGELIELGRELENESLRTENRVRGQRRFNERVTELTKQYSSESRRLLEVERLGLQESGRDAQVERELDVERANTEFEIKWLSDQPSLSKLEM